MPHRNGGDEAVDKAPDGLSVAPDRQVDSSDLADVSRGSIPAIGRPVVSSSKASARWGVSAPARSSRLIGSLVASSAPASISDVSSWRSLCRRPQVVDPRGGVDKDHGRVSASSADRSASRSPSQPTPRKPSRKSLVSGTPTRRRNARSTAARLVVTPYRRMTSATRSSSISMFVRPTHQLCTCPLRPGGTGSPGRERSATSIAVVEAIVWTSLGRSPARGSASGRPRRGHLRWDRHEA